MRWAFGGFFGAVVLVLIAGSFWIGYLAGHRSGDVKWYYRGWDDGLWEGLGKAHQQKLAAPKREWGV